MGRHQTNSSTPFVSLPNYLIASKPPNTGEPIITAKVTMSPKAAITIPKRLFM